MERLASGRACARARGVLPSVAEGPASHYGGDTGVTAWGQPVGMVLFRYTSGSPPVHLRYISGSPPALLPYSSLVPSPWLPQPCGVCAEPVGEFDSIGLANIQMRLRERLERVHAALVRGSHSNMRLPAVRGRRPAFRGWRPGGPARRPGLRRRAGFGRATSTRPADDCSRPGRE
jgi:hypothetical protein